MGWWRRIYSDPDTDSNPYPDADLHSDSDPYVDGDSDEIRGLGAVKDTLVCSLIRIGLGGRKTSGFPS